MVRINLLPDRSRRRARGAPPASRRRCGSSACCGAFVATVLVLPLRPEDEAGRARGHPGATTAASRGRSTPSSKQIADHAADQGAPQGAPRPRGGDPEARRRRARARPRRSSSSRTCSRRAAGRPTDRDKLEQLKHDNPAEVYNPNWDARRLWLLVPGVERTVKMRRPGARRRGRVRARTAPEAERLLQRREAPARQKVDRRETHQELVQFELSAKVRY